MWIFWLLSTCLRQTPPPCPRSSAAGSKKRGGSLSVTGGSVASRGPLLGPTWSRNRSPEGSGLRSARVAAQQEARSVAQSPRSPPPEKHSFVNDFGLRGSVCGTKWVPKSLPGGVREGPGSVREGSQSQVGHLGPSWSHLGASLGPLGAPLGPSWALLEPSWGQLGPSWSPHGAILGPLGALLGQSSAVLGPSWALLEPPGRKNEKS